MRSRIAFAALLLATLAMVSVACAPAAAPAPTAEVVTKVETKVIEKLITPTPAPATGKTYKVALLVNTADHPYIQALIKSFETNCASLGIETQVFDPRMDVTVQASMIDQIIAAKFDGMAYLPVDWAACGPQLQKAHDAGIKLIAMANAVAPELTPLMDSFVGADMWDQGRAIGEMVKEAVGDKPVNIVIVEGMAGTAAAQGRTEGFEEKVKEILPNATILDKQPADWNRNKALEVTQNLLQRFKQIDVVYVHDDDMAQGAIQAIEAAGRQNEMMVFGIGGMCEGYKAIEEGKMYGTVDQAPSLISLNTARAFMDLFNGVPISNNIMIPLPKITKDTLSSIACEW